LEKEMPIGQKVRIRNFNQFILSSQEISYQFKMLKLINIPDVL